MRPSRLRRPRRPEGPMKDPLDPWDTGDQWYPRDRTLPTNNLLKVHLFCTFHPFSNNYRNTSTKSSHGIWAEGRLVDQWLVGTCRGPNTTSRVLSLGAGVEWSMWRVVKLRITLWLGGSRTLVCMITNKFSAPHLAQDPKLPECFPTLQECGWLQKGLKAAALSFEIRVDVFLEDQVTAWLRRKSCCWILHWLLPNGANVSTFSSHFRTCIIQQYDSLMD